MCAPPRPPVWGGTCATHPARTSDYPCTCSSQTTHSSRKLYAWTPCTSNCQSRPMQQKQICRPGARGREVLMCYEWDSQATSHTKSGGFHSIRRERQRRGGAPVDEHVGAGDGVVHGQACLEAQRVRVRRQLRALQQDGPDLCTGRSRNI